MWVGCARIPSHGDGVDAVVPVHVCGGAGGVRERGGSSAKRRVPDLVITIMFMTLVYDNLPCSERN